MSKQASLKTLFQVAFDNGVPAKATIPDDGNVVVEAQPQTQRCSKDKGRPGQCKNRVPLDSKYKLCDHCRGISKKGRQKRTAAFRADPVAQAAAAAQVVIPPGHVRCSQNANKPDQCRRTFSSKSKFKFCDECRESSNKSQKKRYATDPEIRAQKAEYDREYAQTPAGRASKKRSNKKQNKKPVNKMRSCLYATLQKAGAQSRTLKELGTFSSNKAVEKHLESTFDCSWMTWANHGALRHTDGYKTIWHIGHRIPCSVYSLDDLDDARKCFDKRNLFAQDARENIELGDRLVLTDRELLKLKPIWPSMALIKGLDWFKAQFAPASSKSLAVLAAKLKAEEEQSEDEEEEEDEKEEEKEEEEEEEESEDEESEESESEDESEGDCEECE